jgi:hypothetical protein
MNRRFIPIGPQRQPASYDLEGELIHEFEEKFAGFIVISDITPGGGIHCIWDMPLNPADLKPHEARALSEAFAAAADDIAPYKVKP